MGVIIKESLRLTILRISLSVLGALATIFLYPKDKDLYGILGFILDTSVLLTPFIIVGAGYASIKFFPFRNKDAKDRRSFFYKILFLLVISTFVFSIIFFLLKDYLILLAKNPSEDYSKYLIYILPGAIGFGWASVLAFYISNFKKVVLPQLIQFFFKISLPILFFFILIGSVSKQFGVIALVATLIISAVILFFLAFKHLLQNQEYSAKSSEEIKSRSFYNYYFWGFASSIGGVITFKIDGFMVPTLTNFEMFGEYRMAIFMATMITIPIASVLAIASPIISDAWKKNDLKEISSVYLRGSRNLLFIGSAMLIGLLIFLDLLPLLVPEWKDLSEVKLLVLIIGVARIFDMAAGVNGSIIQFSKWYKYNTYFILIMMVINIVLNIVLINKFQLIGAAIATSFSIIVFNSLKSWFLHSKINMHPFNLITTIYLICSIVVCGLLYYTSLNLEWYWALLINLSISILFLGYFLFKTDFAIESRNTIFSLIKKVIA